MADLQPSIPLCVDLDGTLLRTDTLHELILRAIKQSFWQVFILPFIALQCLFRGKQFIKHYLAQRCELNPAALPYNPQFMDFLKQQHTTGRQLVLVTGCHEKTANVIATHLGFFSEVIASDEHVNLTGSQKAKRLVEQFGEKGFDYAGNETVDGVVWSHARECILVNASPFTAANLKTKQRFSHEFDTRQFSIKLLLKAVRLHQWAKNALIFLPALTAHAFFVHGNLVVLGEAFLAFGCCASFSYIVNDLLDLEADRKHRSKKFRPFASGKLGIASGILIALLLMATTVVIASSMPYRFVILLAIYFVTTNLYSFKLKAIPILDVSILAGLYTLRVLAGAVAIHTEVTFWLVAFSAFLFFSLAIVKRISELLYLRENSKEPVKARGYVVEDIVTLQVLGGAAAMATVLVLALYINSSSVIALYKSPRHLWLLCPVLLLWLCRVWLITGRGQMHDDPVVFALKDKVSWLILGLGVAVFMSATFF
jgi:4-hydroxybenzoate polyprenyltransferase